MKHTWPVPNMIYVCIHNGTGVRPGSPVIVTRDPQVMSQDSTAGHHKKHGDNAEPHGSNTGSKKRTAIRTETGQGGGGAPGPDCGSAPVHDTSSEAAGTLVKVV